MSKLPIPTAALDDRLAFIGTSGSGKTYAAGTVIEQMLERKHRVVILDPLDVWWGLRVTADGKGRGFDLPIFGGPHGDLPLTRASGALIGETVAGMQESCIVSLKDLDSDKAEAEFATAFLHALFYKASGQLFHLIVDEADIFAPQHPEAHETRMLSLMNRIVRRGRVRGFIPWLITQRPAALSKNVLSQAVGLVAMSLTIKHDKDAIGGWIKDQADLETGKAILADLPTLQVGEGYVWLPKRKILDKTKFPAKRTFDSSRAPKRGEKIKAVPVKPLDLGALKQKLAKVEEEAKANDPAKLKAEIAELKRKLAKQPAPVASPSAKAGKPLLVADPKAVQAAAREGYSAGLEAARATVAPVAFREGVRAGWDAAKQAVGNALAPSAVIKGEIEDKATAAFSSRVMGKPGALGKMPAFETMGPLPIANVRTVSLEIERRLVSDAPQETTIADGLTKPQQRIVDALAWARAIGLETMAKAQLAFLADASSRSSSYANNLGALRSSGLIDYVHGEVRLTEGGAAIANHAEQAPTSLDVQASVKRKVPPAQWRVLEVLIQHYPGAVSKADLARDAGASLTSSSFANNLGFLRGLGLLTYPDPGMVAASGILFLEGK